MACLFFGKTGKLRMLGDDERISVENLRGGTELLEKIVLRVAAEQ